MGGMGGPGSIEFAILRSGALLCKSCGESRADRVFKWFLVEPEPGDLEEPEGESSTGFDCPHCDFTAKSKAGLNSHVYHKHNKEPEA